MLSCDVGLSFIEWIDNATRAIHVDTWRAFLSLVSRNASISSHSLYKITQTCFYPLPHCRAFRRNLAIVEYDIVIGVLHRVQPMCNGNDRASSQFFTKYSLYADCGFCIDRCRCLMPSISSKFLSTYVAAKKGTRAHHVLHQV